jgi:hypothetical protein
MVGGTRRDSVQLRAGRRPMSRGFMEAKQHSREYRTSWQARWREANAEEQKKIMRRQNERRKLLRMGEQKNCFVETPNY